MTSTVNRRCWKVGRLETPSLGELRSRVESIDLEPGKLSFGEIRADAQNLHADAGNAGALFQVASQFNLLEMVSPSITPEEGVGIYEYDPTQGPACAIAAGAGTIYRNYFVPVNGQRGQSADNQIDCLSDIGEMLGNTDSRLWQMRNGYALASGAGLAEISQRLAKMSVDEQEEVLARLRVGIQWNTQVTLGDCDHLVTQAYCSALPVAYGMHISPRLWEPFARAVLEAAYEATLAAAAINLAYTGYNRVFLTRVGGGAFGNDMDWIYSAIERAVGIFADVPLDVLIVRRGT